MKWVRTIAVSRAMIVIAVLGFLGIFAYAGIGFRADLKFNITLHEDARLIDLSTNVGQLVHELQLERGASAGFIASKGERFGDTLQAQRTRVDATTLSFKNAIQVAENSAEIAPGLDQQIGKILNQLDALQDLRVQVDALSIDLDLVVQSITHLNREAIKLMPEIGKHIFDSETSRAVQRHAILLTAKDIIGLERAIGASGFALARTGDGTFPLEILVKFETLNEEKNILLGLYRALASAEITQKLLELDNHETTQKVNEMVDAVHMQDAQRITAIEPTVWFDTISGMINVVKAIEDEATAEILSHMARALDDMRATLISDVVQLTITLVIFLVLSTILVSSASKSVRQTANRVEQLALGDIDSDIEQAPQSDLNKITVALEKFRLDAVEQRDQSALQETLEESSVSGIKRISEAVAAGDFNHQLRLRDLTGASLILGNGINEILAVAVNFFNKQRKKDADLLAQQRAESDAQKSAAQELNQVVQACSKGDFSQKMNAADKDASWTDVAHGINRISNTTDAALSDIKRIMFGLSAGNLEERMEEGYQGTFEQIAEATNASLDKLRSAFVDIQDAVASIGEAAAQLHHGTADLAKRSEAQAEIVGTSKTATSHLSQTIRTNKQSLQECQEMMVSLAGQTEVSRDVANSAIGSMSAIETASSEVAKIVATIEEIAFQTNLLALNASVEAARAGEAGKGFSVVASEVRALATRCSTASNQISHLISQSVDEVARGSDNVKRTGDAILDIQKTLEQVVGRIETVATASEDQLDGVSSLDVSIQKIDETSQSNQALAKENSALMETVAGLEKRLSARVADFLSETPDTERGEARDAA